MTDLLGPASLPNSTTVMPTDTRTFGANDTWMQDCPTGTTSGGTFLGAQFFNAILTQFRALIRGMGVTVNNANPNMLLTAVQLAGMRAPYGVDLGTLPSTILATTLTPALQQAPAAGDCIRVKMVNNCLGPTSIDPGVYGPYPVVRGDGTPLQPNDYVVGQEVDFRFDGTSFQIGRGSAPTAGSVTASSLAVGAAPLPLIAVQPNDNLHLANDGTNGARDINVFTGRVRDDTDVTNIQIATGMGKRLDQAWAAGGSIGSSLGCCDSGTKGNNQTWHIYAIGKTGMPVTQFSRAANVASLTINTNGLGVGSTLRVVGAGNGFDGLQTLTAVTTNSVSYNNGGANVSTTACAAIADGFDILASQSYPTPAMPSGWTVKQCLGSVMTDGSGNIQAFVQTGDEFIFTGTQPNTIASLVTANRILIGVGTPQGVKTKALVRSSLNAVGSTTVSILTSPDETDVPPTGILFDAWAASGVNGGTTRYVGTNTSGQIGGRSSVAVTSLFTTIGWRDPRRRLF
jgi:hypothetical protein